MKTATAQTGSYIHYKITTDPLFDASYTVSTSGNTVIIDWNRVTSNGRLKDAIRFNDSGHWHCWDEFLGDAVCD